MHCSSDSRIAHVCMCRTQEHAKLQVSRSQLWHAPGQYDCRHCFLRLPWSEPGPAARSKIRQSIKSHTPAAFDFGPPLALKNVFWTKHKITQSEDSAVMHIRSGNSSGNYMVAPDATFVEQIVGAIYAVKNVFWTKHKITQSEDSAVMLIRSGNSGGNYMVAPDATSVKQIVGVIYEGAEAASRNNIFKIKIKSMHNAKIVLGLAKLKIGKRKGDLTPDWHIEVTELVSRAASHVDSTME